MEIFQRRVRVWNETRARAARMSTPPSSHVAYSPTKPAPARRFRDTRVYVVNEDTADEGMAMQRRGLDPLLLNLSDDAFAGGYVGSGSGAQEESLMRRSDYCNTLLQRFYPLGREEAIYSPRVTVFKESEANGWRDMAAPARLAFVTCPALKRPHVADDRIRDDADADAFRDKMRLVMQVAADFGHDSLVLGAWGSGAWGCPPRHCAELWREVLREYDGVFREVAFAILDEIQNTHERSRYAGARSAYALVLETA